MNIIYKIFLKSQNAVFKAAFTSGRQNWFNIHASMSLTEQHIKENYSIAFKDIEKT